MKIDINTKIVTLLKHHPDALERIVGLSPKFAKLRNPLLRKLLAGRTTIAMASKIGGCRVGDFFDQLKGLGFEAGEAPVQESQERKAPPQWLLDVNKQEIKELDVRPVLDAGQDPLEQIIGALKTLPRGEVLKIINAFEPTPLIALVGKRGFSSYVETAAADLVITYFYSASHVQKESEVFLREGEEWEDVWDRFEGRLLNIDVRALPMPKPMLAILEALERLPGGQALFVAHKKIPLYLLPELRERGFAYRIREIEDQHVQLLIFKDDKSN